jgi:uncharacterized protein YggE
MRTKTYILITALAALALLGVFATAAFAQTETPAALAQETKAATRTVSVNGSGKVILTPDIAYVTVGVQTISENASEAVSANNSSTQKVIDALKAAGIADKDLQTTNFSISPQQDYDPSTGKPTGKITYTVNNSVFVTVRDINNVGQVLDASIQAGANNIGGIQFDVWDKTQALSTARKSAVADARSKAEELAGAAGVTLGAVQTINEYTSGGPVPMYDMRAAVPAPAAAASVPVQAGQMTLTVEVSIVYEIQ